MSDYKYWKAALKGENPPIHDDVIHPGFYRKRTGKSAGYVPVAIWEQDGAMFALVDGKPAEAGEIWTWVCTYPIPEQWYRDKMDGKPWPDEDQAVTDSLSHDLKNSGAAPEEIIKDQIETVLSDAEKFAEIKTDEAATQAQAKRSRLLELSGEADKAREDAKKPHLDAGRKIDATWKPLVDMAKAGADKIRAAMAAHENRKREEIRLAAMIAQEVAQKREAAEAAAAKKGKPAPVAAPAPPPAPVPVAMEQVRGGYGRAAAVVTKKVATVVDQDKAYLAMRTHKELVELIAKLAQRAVTAGVTVDGVTWKEEVDVR
jgi:hypothetical protein